MALEVAVRNPERYEGILKTFAKFEGVVLDDEGILDVYSQLYLDEVVTAEALEGSVLSNKIVRKWIKDRCTHNNEWGFPTGYQAAFTRYLKTLSEFGFIYAQYNQPLRLSSVAKALVNEKITLSEAFALQCMRFWRKSPYRRVLNNFNYFEFIMDSLIALNKEGHRLSYWQFMVSLFSDNGSVEEFLNFIRTHKVGDDQEKAYNLVVDTYSQIDSEHARVSMFNTAFRDYGNSVFRVLQLTGFITVDYSGMLMLSPNEDRLPFYEALKEQSFTVSEEAKEDEDLYFEELGSFDPKLEKLVFQYRERSSEVTADYNQKIPHIIQSYNLTRDSIEQALLKVSSGDNRGKDTFWFIQEPVKFEFLLTLFVYSYYGDKFNYQPNFKCDGAGIPYSHAPGNIGDIEIYNNDLYWLIEATLIRSKNQQINSETVNLFRHIDSTKGGERYLTLVAPYIHDDTKLIFNVASIITLIKNNMLSLNSDAQSTDEFVSDMKNNSYFDLVKGRTRCFVSRLTEQLNQINSH